MYTFVYYSIKALNLVDSHIDDYDLVLWDSFSIKKTYKKMITQNLVLRLTKKKTDF